jgi:hypothetical protein
MIGGPGIEVEVMAGYVYPAIIEDSTDDWVVYGGRMQHGANGWSAFLIFFDGYSCTTVLR